MCECGCEWRERECVCVCACVCSFFFCSVALPSLCPTDSEEEFPERDPASVYQSACKRLRILPSNKYLRQCANASVSLAHENFSPAQCQALIEGFEVSFQIESVDLSDCRLDDNAMFLLVPVFSTLGTLKHLVRQTTLCTRVCCVCCVCVSLSHSHVPLTPMSCSLSVSVSLSLCLSLQ